MRSPSTALVLLCLVLSMGIACDSQQDPILQKQEPQDERPVSSFLPATSQWYMNGEMFGRSLTCLPDIDGDGSPDLGLGDPYQLNASGRVVVTSGRTGKLLGWVLGPRDEPSFGREVGKIDNDSGESSLLVSVPWGTHPRIIAFDLPEFRAKRFCDAEPGEIAFGAWFTPSVRRTVQGRKTQGIVVFSTMSAEPPETHYQSITSYRLTKFGLDGLLQARAEFSGEVDMDYHPLAATTIPAADWDELAIADSNGLHLLRGDDLHERWSHPQKVYCEYSIGSVASPGDFDGDGDPDLVFGCPWETRGERQEIGKVVIVSGRDGSVLREVKPNDELDGYGYVVSANVSIPKKGTSYFAVRNIPFETAILEYENFDPDPKSWWQFPDDNCCPDPGWRTFTPGDLDGDGVDDIAISRYSVDCRGSPRQGVIIISGQMRKAMYSLEREPRTQ